jgi:sugar phosphate permease
MVNSEIGISALNKVRELRATRPVAGGKPRFRFVVLSALWVTGMFLYFDRVNISMAAPFIREELGLSGVEIGFILSIYYWGYIVGQLMGGVAADRFKIRSWVIVLYLGWCVTTVATGFCRTVVQFSVIRTIFGWAEGAVINPVTKLQNHWVLPTERGLVNGIQVGAGYMGLVIGMPIVGWLISILGWRAMFWITGLITLAGVFLFWLLVYDHPRDHPWISSEEKHLLEEEIAKDRVTFDPSSGRPKELSFREGIGILAGNWAYWAICIAFFFIAGIYFTNFSWLPGYLVMERGLSGIDSGFSLIVPYIGAALGALLGGYMGDRFNNRSLVIIIAAVLTIPSIAALLAVDGRILMIGTLCLMLFFNAAAVSIFVVLLFDLLPAEVIGVALATMVGIFGGLGGVVGPLVMGYAYDLSGTFFLGFVSMAAGLVVAAVMLGFVYLYERRIKLEKRQKLKAAVARN